MRNFAIFFAVLGTLFSGGMLARELYPYLQPVPTQASLQMPTPTAGVLSLTTPAQPSQIVKDLYNWYITCRKKAEGSCLWEKNESISKKFVDSVKVRPTTGIDPLLCSQEVPLAFHIKELIAKNDQATVSVILSFAKEKIIDVGLAIEEFRYVITNVTCVQ